MFDELQSQYVIAFEPARADRNYHDIEVTMRNTELRVRTRAMWRRFLIVFRLALPCLYR
jgi:hypothetical protein